MRKYKNKGMEKLAAELTAGLLRLRKDYLDAAESLVRLVDTKQEYPYEFVVFRLTGYRPSGEDAIATSLKGKSLRADLLKLMLDLCDSLRIRTSDYDDHVYDIKTLSERFNVSTKTIQRWRRRGLPARRLVFPDSKKRIAFLEESVQWFVKNRREQIARSIKFSQMSDRERDEIIRRAKRMAGFTRCSLSEVAKRLARRSGRAVETIRYTIRKYDKENPGQAIFPYLSSPLDDRDKEVIYRCFLRNVSVKTLAERYSRTRGSIYRIINEMRARQLLGRPIEYIYNQMFELPSAPEEILGRNEEKVPTCDPVDMPHKKPLPKAPGELPPYFKALYDVPLMSAETEREMFRMYNFLKFRADRLREKIDVNHVRTSQLKRVEHVLQQADHVKNHIIRANLRLVVSIAKKHIGGAQTLYELISDGNISLMRAVEKFDYSRGFRFSTYASWAIMRNYARSVPRERYQLDRFATGNDQVLDIAASLRSYDPNEANQPELRESIDNVLNQLSGRERTILIDHYGLDSAGNTKTFDQLGQRLGISKERVRQIELKALEKLRTLLKSQRADLLS
ncbi:MAG: sigma-70 family RNA polymerase sigma factor [Phycisphaerae bacterium]